MEISWGRALWRNSLDRSPDWYKFALVILLIVNPLVFLTSPFVAGWLLVVEFTFILAMALECYPPLPGSLLIIEAIFIGITNVEHIREEVAANLGVLLLLMFMVADIYFMKQLLLFIFTCLLLGIRSKMLLSLSFCMATTFLSALLDVLAAVAAVINVAVGFYSIYHRVASSHTGDADLQDGSYADKHYKVALEQFRGLLHSLMMHAGVGTALDGVITTVGEPQNLIITKAVGWYFGDFFLRMSLVTVPVLICDLLTCLLVKKLRWFDYGETLPEKIRKMLQQSDDQSRHQRTHRDKIRLIVQAIIGVWLMAVLALHLAGTGLIGLSVVILTIPLTDIIDEYAIGKVFIESLLLTALLTVFFLVVAVIIDQQLLSSIVQLVLQTSEHAQLPLPYILNGLLSSVSNNIFVGAICINEARAAMGSGTTTLKQYELLAVAINAGTSLPSVVTPNGQAAFLFLLTSALASLIHLSYSRMVWMALPYTLILTLVGLLYVEFTLAPVTEWFM